MTGKAELFALVKRIRATLLDTTLRDFDFGICLWPVTFLRAGQQSGKHAVMILSRGSSTVVILIFKFFRG